MQRFNNILAITFAELTSGDPESDDVKKAPILSAANFKYYKKEGKFNVIRRACYGTPALVAYNSLPDRIKSKVVAKYGDPESDTRHYVLKDMIVRDLNAEHFYQHFMLDDNTHLKEVDIERYIMNASVINAIINLASKRAICIHSYGKSYGRIWPEISNDLNAIQDVVGCKLPQNHVSLRRVIDKYREGGYEALISQKHGNNNARKNKLSEQDAVITELLGDGRNIDNETVARLYNAVAKPLGWKTITGSTIANYRKEHPECYAGRFGKNAYHNEKQMQNKRKAPSSALYFWCVDGWDTELMFKSKAVEKSTGHSVTVYHNRPTVIAIIDPFNNYIVGYSIGTHENVSLIKEAFRNAIDHVYELFGAYYKPWQIQSDNYGRGALTPFFQRITQFYTPAAVGNAKAKVIERFFGWFNHKYLRLLPNSSGYGVKSSKKIQVSDDWIATHKKDFPDYEGCCAQIRAAIETDRALKREAFVDSWSSLPDDKHLQCSYEDILYAFGEKAEPRKLYGDGIRLQLDGRMFNYDCFDHNFRNYGHSTFFLLYNPSNMDEVLAVQNIGTQKQPEMGPVRFMLKRKYEQPMALMDRKPGDIEELMRVRQYNKEEEETIILKRSQSAEIVRDLFEEHADKLKNTLTAHVITDSLGRHKDQRNIEAGRMDTKPLPIEIHQSKPENDDDDFNIIGDESDFLKDF